MPCATAETQHSQTNKYFFEKEVETFKVHYQLGNLHEANLKLLWLTGSQKRIDQKRIRFLIAGWEAETQAWAGVSENKSTAEILSQEWSVLSLRLPLSCGVAF